MNVELRQATSTDEALVYQVTEATMRTYVERAFGPWVESFQRKIIGKSFHPATHQVILVDGCAVGIIAAPVHDSHIQLEKLFVMPRFQRQGIGSRLLRDLLRSAAAQRKPIRLRVLAVNIDARRFYERFGFVVTNTTPERIFMEFHA